MNTKNNEPEYSKESAKERYFSFTGRLNRQPYFFRNLSLVLANLIITFCFLLCLGYLGIGLSLDSDPISVFTAIFSTVLGLAIFFISFIFGIIITISQISLSVRRLHDLNYSGWWILGIYLIFMIPFVQFLGPIAIILLVCLKGTTGRNKYGEDPLVEEYRDYLNEIE
ncbi:DUF805 domain-containing protein [Selenomonadales bacterium OttesenSCG-928-I06]|nr:DUF805 domain-containing protein [Selenomonadales bacterium OttesenSCG-928-I06]